MPKPTVERVVATLQFDFFDDRFRKWAEENAEAIVAELALRLPQLTQQELVEAGKLILCTGNVAEGTKLLVQALTNARKETDLRSALSTFSMLPMTFGAADHQEVMIDIDRPMALAAVTPFTRHSNIQISRLARGCLNKLDLPEVVALQRDWLNGDDPDAQLDAALELGRQGEVQAWPILRRYIENGPSDLGFWQAAVLAADEVSRNAPTDLKAEIAEFGRAEIRARLHLNDNRTANEVLNLRRMVSAGQQPWHLDFLEEQLRAKTCFAEYVVGEWAWLTGPSAIPRLIAYLDDPVLSRGVIEYIGKTRNPRLGSAEDQAHLKTRLETFMAAQTDKDGPFASTWRSEVAEALQKLGSIKHIEPDAVLDHTAYVTKLRQLGLSGDALFGQLQTAFPTLQPFTDEYDDPWGALLGGLHASGLFATLAAESMGGEALAFSVDEILALAASALSLEIPHWPDTWNSGDLEITLLVDGKARPLVISEDVNHIPEALLACLNAAIDHTGHIYVAVDLNTGGEIAGVAFGKAAELRRLAKEIKLPVYFTDAL